MSGRRLIVEVVDARDLLPKDGLGSSSPYVVVDFDGQRKRTKTVFRDLNPSWHEKLEFDVTDPETVAYEDLEAEVYNDKRTGNGRKSHFLGRVRLNAGQFPRKGNEALVYFPLEKKSFLSWIRGALGLRIYYTDEPENPVPAPEDEKSPENETKPPEDYTEPPEDDTKPPESELCPMPSSHATQIEEQNSPPENTAPPPENAVLATEAFIPGPETQPPPLEHAPPPPETRIPVRPPIGMTPRRVYGSGAFTGETKIYPAHDLVEAMKYLFVRIVKARGLAQGSGLEPVVKIRLGSYSVRKRPDSRNSFESNPEWNQVFAFGRERLDSSANTLEISVWAPSPTTGGGGFQEGAGNPGAGDGIYRNAPGEFPGNVQAEFPGWGHGSSGDVPGGFPSTGGEPPMDGGFPGSETGFRGNAAGGFSGNAPAGYPSAGTGFSGQLLGGVCFDLSEVPVRSPSDSPLAPQWYRLDGDGHVCGDIMLSVWIGTQADDSFSEAWQSDAPHLAHTRSKVYHSPKLWYLRLTVIEAQDLPISRFSETRVKVQLGFQSSRTRPSPPSQGGSVSWHEDLLFVASEPLEDAAILLVEERFSGKEPSLVGHVMIPLAPVEQRLDERLLPSRWFVLESPTAFGGESGGGTNATNYRGRMHLRLCLEGGYHVLDEAAHFCSDFRPTARQLWRPPIGTLELGILGARALLPMKTQTHGPLGLGPGAMKGSTDAYCVAKYGHKWVRTRTLTDSFDPRWNEQYTWQVYDPCTVLTIAVFDNWHMFSDKCPIRPDTRIGKIRIRVSALEGNKVHTRAYPLLVLLRSGLKKMGELDLAIRYTCGPLIDTCGVYTRPMLPRMHYTHPIGLAQQDALRAAAARSVAAWLTRSEPPLGPEVVQYMLDSDSHTWSMRRSKANWFRVMSVLAWLGGLAHWVHDVRQWRNSVQTILVHVLFLVLVWYPELVVPTIFFYIAIVGAWYYRFRPVGPMGMDTRLSQAESSDFDELEEEFDLIPSSRPSEVVRARYDRLRVLAGRVQSVLGDLAAQGERAQALIAWRDPRATRLFVGSCLAASFVMYVSPPKVVAVALGFYFLRHPMFRDPMPPPSLNFFRRLPSLSDRML
ncbi:protein QUIRKY [Amborella trichopoda]|uniref:C2 domain-containing protein n=1 Tax=Amborella trichopoda TaxID=13333 RepID=W1P1T3_AMBTC|nr:protein QUIRKY [Amborella trichopoda]ERN03792.1 hypothetical protein AMTR_s00078p00102770 [Amborella trichopoda]|eukprot:XP_020521570.1 protein QUIRKY [Amborella trichopoda]